MQQFLLKESGVIVASSALGTQLIHQIFGTFSFFELFRSLLDIVQTRMIHGY